MRQKSLHLYFHMALSQDLACLSHHSVSDVLCPGATFAQLDTTGKPERTGKRVSWGFIIGTPGSSPGLASKHS